LGIDNQMHFCLIGKFILSQLQISAKNRDSCSKIHHLRKRLSSIMANQAYIRKEMTAYCMAHASNGTNGIVSCAYNENVPVWENLIQILGCS